MIGNGDVWNAQDYTSLVGDTGCDSVMIARASIGNPWIFQEIKAALAGEPWQPPTVNEVVDVLVDHLDREVELKGERMGVKRMRKQMGSYLRGVRNAAKLRQAIFQVPSRDGVVKLLRDYLTEQRSAERALKVG